MINLEYISHIIRPLRAQPGGRFCLQTAPSPTRAKPEGGIACKPPQKSRAGEAGGRNCLQAAPKARDIRANRLCAMPGHGAHRYALDT